MKSTTISLVSSLVSVALHAQSVLGWGAVGHEIVATIAQIHLYPSAVSNLCSVLPEYANCHLAPVATWADTVRMKMRWSSTLHYVNGVGDHPAQHCVFGEEGWQGKEGYNVLSAIRNTTGWLEEGYDGAEEALKFLIHFVGDLHQPLHLTGRDKGGNGAKVRFDGRITNLHSVWDSALIAKTLRTIPLNYTRPLPSRRIEGALRDTIYDPYIRQIMFEGVLGRFKDDLDEWTTCPIPADLNTRRSTRKRKSQTKKSQYRAYPIKRDQIPLKLDLGSTSAEEEDALIFMKDIPRTDDDIVCPFAWATPLHKLNCDIIWPLELDDPVNNLTIFGDEDQGELKTPTHYLELDTPKYSGRIKKEWIMERLLAMGGIRLAAVLNYLFADADETSKGLVNVNLFD